MCGRMWKHVWTEVRQVQLSATRKGPAPAKQQEDGLERIFKLTVSAAVVLILFTSFAALCDEKDKLKPSLYINNTKADLGTIYEGGEATHEFVLLNKGQGELNILRVKAP
ncbi:MAG: DUF1573 domain-containing protein [Candidatus Latescibacteria bacterium]|nr:DUF1573 domain-containing protein [bacterium]MBD3424824.1 DUF1573 domain-containing protein [Candidatus Latescibacterota bacterium]